MPHCGVKICILLNILLSSYLWVSNLVTHYKKNLDLVITLQKKCIRIINFAPFNSHTNDLFISNEFLKFGEIIIIEQMKLIFDFKMNNLPTELMNLFKFNHNVSNYTTRRVSLFLASLLRVLEQSLKYSTALLWNNHLKIDDKINLFNKVGPFKRYLKNIFLLL